MVYDTIWSPIMSKTNFFFARRVSTTLIGISTTQVLHAFNPDIVTGTINGFDCIYAQGQKAEAFLDMCGFFGNYLA